VVQIRLRRARARLGLFALAALALFAAAGCGTLYTGEPRYGRGKPRPKPKPGAPRPGAKPAPKKRAGTLPWPAQGPVVTQFGNIVDPKYKTVTKSNGIDIETKSGSPVLAVEAGKVSFADMFVGHGRMIIVDHGNRCHSIYSKLSDLKVKVGDAVAKGGVVALAADTLHFEFRVGGKSVDPLEWLVPR
jgi:septal ring factor EnvC (AmiA/AmiB activator)